MDEDRTSACSFVSNSLFKCENKNDQPAFIFSSRVHDGVGREVYVSSRFAIAAMVVTRKRVCAKTRAL